MHLLDQLSTIARSSYLSERSFHVYAAVAVKYKYGVRAQAVRSYFHDTSTMALHSAHLVSVNKTPVRAAALVEQLLARFRPGSNILHVANCAG